MLPRPLRFRAQTLLLLGALCLLATSSPADAKLKKRFGWQSFAAKYQGGYTVSPAIDTATGPAKIRIRTTQDGRSARVSWTNTFYTPRGSYNITVHWTFRSDGTVTATSLDPRARNLAGSGTFVLDRNRPVKFSVRDATGLITGSGEFKLNGGGSLLITGTITGLPGGAVTFGFSGGRM